MLNLAELEILNACADDYELFYFPFAEVNYGGQVVRVDSGDPARRFSRRFEDEGPWGITVPGEEIALYVMRLIWSGLLRGWRVSDDPERRPAPGERYPANYSEPIELTEPDEREFAIYRGYDCVTWQEHMERFGYGPHEFRITYAGTEEINRPVYDEFVEG